MLKGACHKGLHKIESWAAEEACKAGVGAGGDTQEKTWRGAGGATHSSRSLLKLAQVLSTQHNSCFQGQKNVGHVQLSSATVAFQRNEQVGAFLFYKLLRALAAISFAACQCLPPPSAL